MKKKILETVAAGEPLFREFPVPATRNQIIGLESEYGVGWKRNTDIVDIDVAKLPAFWENGSCAYKDGDHVEYCTGEEVDPLRATLSYEAGKILCWDAAFSLWLDNYSRDRKGCTFGGIHENYLRRAPRREWHRMVPFLVARTLFVGAGFVDGDLYQLSQRVDYIDDALGGDTPSKRVIVTSCDEPLMNVRGCDRMHIICGDPHMSPMNTFLTIGLTGMVGELMDMGALPDIRYNRNRAVEDMRALSHSVSDWNPSAARKSWFMKGVENGPRSALEFLDCYLRAAEKCFGGRDEITDAVLVIGRDTLEKLSRDPWALRTRLDWVVKLYILDAFRKAGHKDYGWLRSQDIEYHVIGVREKDGSVRRGLFRFLLENGFIEQLYSKELLARALSEPSPYTRAFLRGRVAAAVRQEFRKEWKMDRGNGFHWEHLRLVPRRIDRNAFSVNMRDPFRTYGELFPRIQKMLQGGAVADI